MAFTGAASMLAEVVHSLADSANQGRLFLGGAKVVFATDLDVVGLAAAIDSVEEQVRAAVPEARVIYIEPDVQRPRSPARPTHPSDLAMDPGDRA